MRAETCEKGTRCAFRERTWSGAQATEEEWRQLARVWLIKRRETQLRKKRQRRLKSTCEPRCAKRYEKWPVF